MEPIRGFGKSLMDQALVKASPDASDADEAAKGRRHFGPIKPWLGYMFGMVATLPIMLNEVPPSS
jgi:hypothetical protein